MIHIRRLIIDQIVKMKSIGRKYSLELSSLLNVIKQLISNYQKIQIIKYLVNIIMFYFTCMQSCCQIYSSNIGENEFKYLTHHLYLCCKDELQKTRRSVWLRLVLSIFYSLFLFYTPKIFHLLSCYLPCYSSYNKVMILLERFYCFFCDREIVACYCSIEVATQL